MSRIDGIENSIRALTAEELAEFRKWFVEFDAELWDRQLEAEVKAGKLWKIMRPGALLRFEAFRDDSILGDVHELPDEIQAAFERLKQDPRHPSLRFKKVGQFWTARVGLHYRDLGRESEDAIISRWIGTQAEYDNLLR